MGKYLTITMDKKVLSSPVIQTPITGGEGVINGSFTLPDAQSIVLQLKYGSLPVPLKVVENRTVGPTLGEDSVNKSLVAGIIGLGIVAFFMLAYYRFPGGIAVSALLIYTMSRVRAVQVGSRRADSGGHRGLHPIDRYGGRR